MTVKDRNKYLSTSEEGLPKPPGVPGGTWDHWRTVSDSGSPGTGSGPAREEGRTRGRRSAGTPPHHTTTLPQDVPLLLNLPDPRRQDLADWDSSGESRRNEK